MPIWSRKKKWSALSRQKKAPTGFEPVHKGFADLSLTTWVRRRSLYYAGYNIQKSGCSVKYLDGICDHLKK